MSLRGNVSIELSDKTVVLKYNYNRLCDFNEVADMDLAQMGPSSSLTPSALRAFVWAGLQWQDISIEEAGEVIDQILQDKGADYLGEKIEEAMESIFPEPDTEELEDSDGADIKNSTS